MQRLVRCCQEEEGRLGLEAGDGLLCSWAALEQGGVYEVSQVA